MTLLVGIPGVTNALLRPFRLSQQAGMGRFYFSCIYSKLYYNFSKKAFLKHKIPDLFTKKPFKCDIIFHKRVYFCSLKGVFFL